MGMMIEPLTPGMENAEEADLGAETFRVESDFGQRLGGEAAEQVVDELLVLQRERRDPSREREHDMSIRGGQDLAGSCVNPATPGVCLALGTVPVSARVVRDGAITAPGTQIEMRQEQPYGSVGSR